MATNVIMPALEMAQESGRLVSWLKREGETVTKGEPLMEIETDKVTVEIEAPDSGVLGGVLIKENEEVPVGQTIAWILAPGEKVPSAPLNEPQSGRVNTLQTPPPPKPQPAPAPVSLEISPVARRIAEEHGIDLALVKGNGRRIEKADILAYIDATQPAMPAPAPVSTTGSAPGRVLASPKARRLAGERGIDLTALIGSGPGGAVLAEDVPFGVPVETVSPALVSFETPGTVWRVMAERMSHSWTTVPHFYLVREVDASLLIEWRERVAPAIEKRIGIKPTYTDLLVKLIGFALHDHSRLNAAWADGNIQWNQEINVGIAVAIEAGLIVPVIRNADGASLSEIAAQRADLVVRAQGGKLRPADISDGTFTLTNLGMYNVDAFDAIINTPQAAILSVGRIADRVVPVDGQVAIRPMMVLTLSLDHRIVDGARAAQFLDDLANLIEDPWRLLV
jgi:pyruvate dehydrogenase E2 component (dihydrolipoyllysine-residue acetyltransferase)